MSHLAVEYLFVYGTLCRQADGRQHPLIGDAAEFFSTACLPGKLYEIDGYPGAVVEPETSQFCVRGELYRLLLPQPLFQLLDAYEECADDYPKPHEYRREIESVMTDAGDNLSAWVYVYNRPLHGRRWIVSGDYRLFQQSAHRT